MLEQHALEKMISVLVRKGAYTSSEARLVVDTAHHAAVKSMETMATVCLALKSPTDNLMAMTLACQILQVAAEVERESLRDFAVEISAEYKKKGSIL